MCVSSLVLGIIALVISIFSAGLFGWLGAILAIIGIVLGALGRKNPEKKGIATAGLVVSIVGLALGIILYAACTICAKGAADAIEDGALNEIQSALETMTISIE